MDTTTTRQNQGSDVAKDLAVDMVKSIVKLTAGMDVLVRKVEDLTSALDDHRGELKDFRGDFEEVRESIDASANITDDFGNLVGAFLSASEKLSDLAESREDDEDVTFADFGRILRDMRKEVESEAEDDE